MPFDLSTVIPTASRNAIKATIVAQSGFEAWRTDPNGGNNVHTRNLTKAAWINAAHALGVADACADLIANPPAQTDTPEAGLPMDVETTPAPKAETGETMSADAVLSIVRPFLAPALVSQVEAACAPIVERANRPPVEIVRTETVYQTLAPGAKAPTVAPASPIEQTTIGKAFGIRGRLASGVATFWNAADAPRADAMYVSDADLVGTFAGAVEDGDFVWLAGPAGSGKTTLPRQVAATLYRPFVRIAFNRATEPTDLLGMDKLDGAGGMAWADGVLSQAIRKPGTIILLDEPTFAPPGILATLQTLLDERRMTINATGEVVHCAKGVYFCAADNTRGYGDETGRYAGTMQANSALIDRFALMLTVDYMSVEKEAQALANHTGAPRDACETVAAFVKLARGLAGFGDVPLSLRRMVAFVKATKRGQTVKRAFEDSFLTRLPDAERSALQAAFRAHFPDAAFEAQLNGSPAPAPVSQDPAQVAARGAFDPVE